MRRTGNGGIIIIRHPQPYHNSVFENDESYSRLGEEDSRSTRYQCWSAVRVASLTHIAN